MLVHQLGLKLHDPLSHQRDFGVLLAYFLSQLLLQEIFILTKIVKDSLDVLQRLIELFLRVQNSIRLKPRLRDQVEVGLRVEETCESFTAPVVL